MAAKTKYVAIGLGLGGGLLLLLVCGGLGVGGYLLWDAEGLAESDAGKKPFDRATVRIHNPKDPGDVHLLQDPKWRADGDLKSLAVGGRWYAKSAVPNFLEFFADGRLKCSAHGDVQGTYHFTGAEVLEFRVHLVGSAIVAGSQEVIPSYCFLGGDEMVLLDARARDYLMKPNEYVLRGQYLRLRDDGTGPGHATFIAPVTARLRSTDLSDRQAACRELKTFGRDAWPAVPELIRLVESDPPAALTAMDTLARIGPRARDALPALEKQLSHGENLHRDSARKAIAWIQKDTAASPWGGTNNAQGGQK